MYVNPQSDIYLLKGVPLEPTYDHTLYFESEALQSGYFLNNAGIKQFTRQTYQRVEKGALRIADNANNLNDYNYLMFRNTRSSTVPTSKWFYAFITGVEYVNENLTEISYEIDHLQTWFFEMRREECFVEREHSLTDVAGDNIVPEPVRIGDYWYGNQIPTQWTDNVGTSYNNIFKEYGIILVCPYKRIMNAGLPNWINAQGELPVPPTEIGNQKCGLYYTVLKTELAIGKALYELNDQGKASSIVCLYPVPLSFLFAYEDYDILEGDAPIITVTYYGANTRPTTLGNYTPINKKLLTAPYNKFVIDTSDGNIREYAYEFFTNPSAPITFDIHANLLTTTSFKAVPNLYKNRQKCYQEAALLTDFPLSSYTVDSFKAWLAQNKTRVAFQTVEALSGVGSGFGAIAAGQKILTPKTKVLSTKGARMMAKGFEQVSQSILDSITGTLSDVAAERVNYAHAQGTTDGSIEIAMEKKDFVGYQMYVNPNDAEIIDNFFTLFGYATHKVKIPNIAARPHWTFTKTVGCKIGGNIPSEANEAICAIFNNGITFWRKPSEVGNYSLDNSPAT